MKMQFHSIPTRYKKICISRMILFFHLEPAFGQDFSGPTGNPTLIIKKLVKAVEEKGLELKDVYLSPVPFLELLVMRNALNQGAI